jgi:nucleotide-binding universal stress UspA family protein
MIGGGPMAAAVGSLTTPLLAVRSLPDIDADRGPILVASDGLEGSDRLVQFATRLSRSRGASVHLLHVASNRSAKRRERRLHGPLAIGSVSRQVVHKADCSVLLMPHEHLQA